MATSLVPVKTTEGQAELGSRRRGLGQRHRTVLLLVDGRRTEAQVRALARQAGAPDSCFGELLQMGLIRLPEATAGDSTCHVDIPIDEPAESVLPPIRTLPPDSLLDSRSPGASSDSVLQDLDAIADAEDPALEEARAILMRAVRAEAPVAGSLTLLKLRRARTRQELAELLEEVETRIAKPHRALTAQQTVRRVRALLAPAPEDRSPAA